MIGTQLPIRVLGPLGRQGHVLADWDPEVEDLVLVCPSVESMAFALRVALRRAGQGAILHGRLRGRGSVRQVEPHHVRGLFVWLFRRLG